MHDELLQTAFDKMVEYNEIVKKFLEGSSPRIKHSDVEHYRIQMIEAVSKVDLKKISVKQKTR
jgi:dsDNA-binding SOS-regulon protein